MLEEMRFTEARGEFSSLYSKVFNDYQPVIIRRRQAEEVMVLRTDLQKLLLEKYRLKPEVLHEEDGSVTLALDEVELYTNGQTVEEAAQELARELKLYARDYFERSHLFINASNRRSHFPYILRVLLCDTDEEILELLEI